MIRSLTYWIKLEYVSLPQLAQSCPRLTPHTRQRSGCLHRSQLPIPLLLLLLIPMPLDGEEHAGAEHDDLEREEDDREPIPHFGDIQALIELTSVAEQYNRTAARNIRHVDAVEEPERPSLKGPSHRPRLAVHQIHAENYDRGAGDHGERQWFVKQDCCFDGNDGRHEIDQRGCA